VDAAGNVWVDQTSPLNKGELNEYTNAESNVFKPPTLIAEGNFTDYAFGHSGFAVDSEDYFYILVEHGIDGPPFPYKINNTPHEDNYVYELFDHALDEEASSALAVELSSNDSYVDNLTSVARFSSSGVEEERFGAGELTSGEGIGVSSSSGEVYVADSAANRVVVFVPEPPRAPTVEKESVLDVSGEGATFEAEINPRGEPTEYHFEYGPCATPTTCASSSYEKSTPASSAGSEFVADAVTVHVQELIAGTVYHIRGVAVNRLGAAEGVEEKTFTTQTAGGFALPDGRQWEMVSPPQKEGALFLAPGGWGSGIVQAAAGGDAITYSASVPTELGAAGVANFEQVFSRRGPDGWATSDLGTPHSRPVAQSPGQGQEYRAFSEDLSQAILQPQGAFTPCRSAEGVAQPCLSPDASAQTAFLHTDFLNGNVEEPCTSGAGGHCYTPLETGCPLAPAPCEPAVRENANVPDGTVFGGGCPPERFCGPFFVGASPDESHIVLSTTDAATQEGLLSEWSAGAPPGEQLQTVSVLPDGSPTAADTFLGTHNTQNSIHAISGDGSRVFWSAGPNAEKPELYMRDNSDRPPSPLGENDECLVAADACTVQISGGGTNGRFCMFRG
jgi:hypothetical protein